MLGASVGAAILDYAEHIGADSIVSGGYGHSRLRERLLGGVTRELLHTASVPVLFAH
jgi:nucleotide-binding universal stress UspA family protein